MAITAVVLTDTDFPETFQKANELWERIPEDVRPSFRKFAASLLLEKCNEKLTQIARASQENSLKGSQNGQ
jgi:hypothetical protein